MLIVASSGNRAIEERVKKKNNQINNTELNIRIELVQDQNLKNSACKPSNSI